MKTPGLHERLATRDIEMLRMSKNIKFGSAHLTDVSVAECTKAQPPSRPALQICTVGTSAPATPVFHDTGVVREGDGESTVPAHPLIRERALRARIEAEPMDMELKTDWIALQRALASAEASSGRKEHAVDRLRRAFRAIHEMLCFDPSNEAWIEQHDRLEAEISDFPLLSS